MNKSKSHLRTLLALSLVSGFTTFAGPAGAVQAGGDDTNSFVIARNGADNVAGDVRRGRGADDPVNHG